MPDETRRVSRRRAEREAAQAAERAPERVPLPQWLSQEAEQVCTHARTQGHVHARTRAQRRAALACGVWRWVICSMHGHRQRRRRLGGGLISRCERHARTHARTHARKHARTSARVHTCIPSAFCMGARTRAIAHRLRQSSAMVRGRRGQETHGRPSAGCAFSRVEAELDGAAARKLSVSTTSSNCRRYVRKWNAPTAEVEQQG